MDIEEQKQEIKNSAFDKDNDQNDYNFLVQKLKSISEIIHLLEKKFFDKEI